MKELNTYCIIEVNSDDYSYKIVMNNLSKIVAKDLCAAYQFRLLYTYIRNNLEYQVKEIEKNKIYKFKTNIYFEIKFEKEIKI